jgi:hypothetical protein
VWRATTGIQLRRERSRNTGEERKEQENKTEEEEPGIHV